MQRTTLRNLESKGQKRQSKPGRNKTNRELTKLLNKFESLQDLRNFVNSLDSSIVYIKDKVLNKHITPKEGKKQIQSINETKRIVKEFDKKILLLFIEQALEEQQNICALNRLYSQSYRYRARFKIRPKDLPNIKGYNLLQKLGYYNKDSNPTGVVMDHRYSIKDGIDNRVTPEILGKLYNCEFLTYQENIRKYSNSSITLEQLIFAA